MVTTLKPKLYSLTRKTTPAKHPRAELEKQVCAQNGNRQWRKWMGCIPEPGWSVNHDKVKSTSFVVIYIHTWILTSWACPKQLICPKPHVLHGSINGSINVISLPALWSVFCRFLYLLLFSRNTEFR